VYGGLNVELAPFCRSWSEEGWPGTTRWLGSEGGNLELWELVQKLRAAKSAGARSLRNSAPADISRPMALVRRAGRAEGFRKAAGVKKESIPRSQRKKGAGSSIKRHDGGAGEASLKESRGKKKGKGSGGRSDGKTPEELVGNCLGLYKMDGSTGG